MNNIHMEKEPVTIFNYLGIILIALGVYYCLDRKPSKESPDVPPSVSVGFWRIEYYMDKDEQTIWRMIYKSDELFDQQQYWNKQIGFKEQPRRFKIEDITLWKPSKQKTPS
jgi:hypothetical protein